MSENSISKDFLSKENIANLYKQITISNEYSNLNKQQKDFIINQLIDTMKKVYKTSLDLSKINQINIESVKKQFNSIVLKQTNDLIKNNIKTNNQTNNDRNNQRTFESVKRTMPNPTTIDRPISSLLGKPVIPTQMNVSDDYLKKTTGDLASRLSELENNRKIGNDNRPPDIPDFLKPTKVGKITTSETPSINIPERRLEGIGGFDSDNFKKDNMSVDTSKYNDNLSLQDRLKQLEAERGMPPSLNNSNSTNINPNMSNVSDMFSNTISQLPQSQQPPQHYQPPQPQPQPQSQPQQYQPLPLQQYQQPQPQYQQPQSQQYQQPQSQQYQQPQSQQYQQPQSQQYQPLPPQQQPQPPQPPPQYINELNQIIQSLKQENEFLKNEIIKLQNKKGPLTKTLQLDISKKDNQYNFQFNPINNVVSLKLLSYNLPLPIYNIIDDTQFMYTINNNTDTEYKIYISKGNYNIDNLLNYLNNNPHLLFSIDFTQKVTIKSKDENILFQIIPTLLSHKLGFNNQQFINNVNIISANTIYDIRMPSKLLLFIRNINSNEPVCSLNFNNTSICNLQFNNPLVLSSLQLEFYLEDNTLYNFNDLFYNLSFAIDIMEFVPNN